MVKAIFFDLDDTLMFEIASEQEAFLIAGELARGKHGINPDKLRETVMVQAKALWTAAPTYSYCSAMGISSWEGLWGRFTGEDINLRLLREWVPAYQYEVWVRALHEMGIDDASLAAQMAQTYQTERRKRHIPFPDAVETLQALRKSHKLGIITNGAPDIQREKIEAGFLSDLFDVVVVSGEVGVGKPNPGIFQIALKQAGVEPEEAIMVGDRWARDITGAHAAGMHSVLIDYNHTGYESGTVGTKSGDGPCPLATISRLADLPAVLKNC